MTKQEIIEQLRGLDTDDKLDLLYRLWDEIAEELESRPASEATRRFLDDRLRDIEADPRPGRSWDEVRGDLLPER
jgi:putative addiction module component (TIGR02574 family)